MVAAKSMEIYREAAAERMKEGGRKGGQHSPNTPQTRVRPNDLTLGKNTQSRVAAGEAVGTCSTSPRDAT